MSIDYSQVLEKAQSWLTPTFDEHTQKLVKELIATDKETLQESFYKDLEFGTGGMRGIMGVGTNRINKYTLGKNTQGLSNYLKKVYPNKQLQVAIAFDCRKNSKELAQVVANVFSANGIKVFLFSELRPTPELSFAVKYLNCHCGIVLTASHNPPEYNGYKVYWTDGGQVVPPQDQEIIEEINSLDFGDINFEANPNNIDFIDTKIDEAFINASLQNGNFNAPNKNKLKVVFTSLHGTSITIVPKVLEKAGYNVHIVKEQATPDGNFPTVKSPNPEEPEALTLALQQAEEINADIVIGTDPDCDRLGIAVRDLNGKLRLLNGNQTMVLMTKFLLDQWKNADKITGNEFIGSTIVSTPMMNDLAVAYNVECKVGLTGFKWIAKMIKDHPEQAFIGGGEESFGFMVGDFVRDKDAVTSTLLACEIAATAKAKGSSFFKELVLCYKELGFYKEKLISITKKGIQGAEEIKQMMANFRNNPLQEIDGSKVVMLEDYLASEARNMISNETEPINIPKSNVLIFYTEDGTKIAARPSGTEPKIKFYFSVKTTLNSIDNFNTVEQELDNKINRIITQLNL